MSISLARDSAPDDRQLERYLLGLLSDDETERLDQAAIERDEVAWRLRVVEYDLIDAYVRRNLDRRTLERFESHYLSRPGRRASVNAAEQFLQVVDRIVGGVGSGPDTLSDPGSSSSSDEGPAPDDFVGRRRPWAASTRKITHAAALLVITFGGLSFEAIRRTDWSTAAHPSGVAESTARERPSGNLNAPAAGSTPTASSPAAMPAEPPRPLPVTLFPQTRGIEQVPSIAVSPHGSVAVRLQLQSIDYPRYRAGLRDPVNDRIVWRSGWMTPEAEADRRSLTVVVPARVLKPQHYSLELNGPDSEDGLDTIGSYRFQVVSH